MCVETQDYVLGNSQPSLRDSLLHRQVHADTVGRLTQAVAVLSSKRKEGGALSAPPSHANLLIRIRPISATVTFFYRDAVSALPLRNISLTVATKWCADGGVGTAPLKMVL